MNAGRRSPARALPGGHNLQEEEPVWNQVLAELTALSEDMNVRDRSRFDRSNRSGSSRSDRSGALMAGRASPLPRSSSASLCVATHRHRRRLRRTLQLLSTRLRRQSQRRQLAHRFSERRHQHVDPVLGADANQRGVPSIRRTETPAGAGHHRRCFSCPLVILTAPGSAIFRPEEAAALRTYPGQGRLPLGR